MRTIRILVLALVALSIAGLVSAAIQARIFGSVLDSEGNPVANAKIVIRFGNVVTDESDRNGKYFVTLVDPAGTITYRVEAEGFAVLEGAFEGGVRLNHRHDFKLFRPDSAEALATAPPDPAVTAFNEGAEAFAQGDTMTALDKMQEAVRLNPELAAAHAAIGRLYAGEDRYSDAAVAAEAALALESDNLMALQVAFAAYTELGETEKLAAVQLLLDAADPTAAAVSHYQAGVGLFNEGDTEGAATEFERAIASSSEHAKSHYLLGLCYSGMGEMARAKEHFETFLRLAPEDEDAAAAQEMLKYLN
jgi:tetratricopeptide (TPR) repeat protein